MAKIIYKKEILGVTEDEKEFADNLIHEYCEKAEKTLGEDLTIEVYVKKYGKVKTNEYEVNLRLFCSENNSSNLFIESNATERDYGKTVKSALKKMDTEMEHKLHVSDRRKR